ncbi:MAG: bifunctional diaminohydroxyphosphoribosylaminopyrimidine deaminase/5-amino-6-(5-phosphoribosylamino)uracil reductase RibD [Pseudomonadota bacterium]
MPACTQNERFMKRALALAKQGAGWVSPNPLVGAVVVNAGKIVGTGYHEFFGGPHAEVTALKNAGSKAKGAELYINLEPCCHFGKTPPCTDVLIQKGIKKVFLGMIDPNPAVAGKGIQKLMSAGIAVEAGLLEHECRQLNEAFVKFITEKKPFVILKAALTLDGNIATSTGDSKWITCDTSRALAHKIRHEVDAVMVGIGTVLADDPQLTVRLHKGAKKNPFRIIVDTGLSIPLTCNVLKPELAEKTLIAASPEKAASRKAQLIRKTGARVLGIPLFKKRVDLRKLLFFLGTLGIASLLIEGGSELNASAFACGIVDKVMLFYAPKIIGGRDAVKMVGGPGIKMIADAISIHDISIRRISTDFLVEGYLKPGSQRSGC